MRSVLAIAAAVSAATLSETRDSLEYVFEITRHGARAPLEKDPHFKAVPPCQLSFIGMRQKYLLGRYDRQKYNASISFDDARFTVTSTMDYRVLESGNSQLLGLFYEDLQAKNHPLLKDMKRSQAENARVPFKTRRAVTELAPAA